MFAGIITEIGRVSRVQSRSGVAGAVMSLDVDAPATAGGVKVGDSVSVNGVCLTAVRVSSTISFDILGETVDRTTLNRLQTGSRVNLELAITLNTRIGGHMISGHIDTVAAVTRIDRSPGGVEWRLEPSSEWLRYIVDKGSVALDGVSLTAYRVDGSGFYVSLIPHTLEATHFSQIRVGDYLNIEVDILAKYVEKLFPGKAGSVKGQLTKQSLADAGFIR